MQAWLTDHISFVAPDSQMIPVMAQGQEPGMQVRVLTLESGQGHLEGAFKQASGPNCRVSDLIGLKWDLRICSSNEFSSEAAAGPGTTLWGPQMQCPLPRLARATPL